MPPNPADTPPNWCQGSEPTILTNIGVCHYKINGVCPDWCYECSDTALNCSDMDYFSVVDPLHFTSDYGTFVAGATIDEESGRVYFGTMDGRFFALDLATGNQVWQSRAVERARWAEPGQAMVLSKFAWHLSPPSIYDGKLYFGSFLPAFTTYLRQCRFVLDASGHSVFMAVIQHKFQDVLGRS